MNQDNPSPYGNLPGGPLPEERLPQRPAPPARRGLPLPTVKPFWTYVLIGINVAIWLGVMLNPDFVLGWLIQYNRAIAAGEYWRLFTAMFLHQEIWHIGFNMYALYALGLPIEAWFGRGRFLTIYLLGGLVGSALMYIFTPLSTYSLGASGAIFALFGAMGAFLLRNRQALGDYARRQLGSLATVLLLNVVLSFLPGIGLWAHFGGLLAGFVLGLGLTPVYGVQQADVWGTPRVVDRGTPLLRLVVIAVVAVAFLALVAFGSVYRLFG